MSIYYVDVGKEVRSQTVKFCVNFVTGMNMMQNAIF